ncbi:MAG: anthranilate synthase component I family protein [Elusimicrobia bacterium]|nr:anthranilate synthase component I family protein [Elusimicrobiota bacterium]
MTPSFRWFCRAARGHPIVPFWVQWPDPLPEDLTWAWRLNAGEPRWALLDSASPGPQATFSYVSTGPAHLVVGARGHQVWREVPGKSRVTHTVTDPVVVLERVVRTYRGPHIPGMPDRWGGAVGYFAYECGRFFDPAIRFRSRPATPESQFPDFLFGFFTEGILIEHKPRRAWLVACVRIQDRSLPGLRRSFAQGRRQLKELAYRLTASLNGIGGSTGVPLKIGSAHPEMSQGAFEAMVRQAKRFIAAGDIYQANLAQRFVARCEGDPWTLYQSLKRINPSPYACYLRFPEVTLVSCSPELLLRVSGRVDETRPIAGTRPRGGDPVEDQRLSAELLLDPKERAEHIMLVDLERNDLGRVSIPGTVRVAERMVLERYSHVTHIVSHVEGYLSEGKTAFDALRALFPGGTITGCPKIRAMQIIETLEAARRGPYCGSAGFLSFTGRLDLNILIRTFILQGERLSFSVGAGIVADSDPTREYHETLHKGQALLAAIRAHQVPRLHRVRAFVTC